jgi:hypothetical protein
MQLGGTPAQLFDQARDGVADIVWTLPTIQPAASPSLEVFELPFFTHSAKGSSQAYWTYVQKNALDEYKGVKICLHTNDGTLVPLVRQGREDAGGPQGPEDPRGHPHELAHARRWAPRRCRCRRPRCPSRWPRA